MSYYGSRLRDALMAVTLATTISFAANAQQDVTTDHSADANNTEAGSYALQPIIAKDGTPAAAKLSLCTTDWYRVHLNIAFGTIAKEPIVIPSTHAVRHLRDHVGHIKRAFIETAIGKSFDEMKAPDISATLHQQALLNRPQMAGAPLILPKMDLDTTATAPSPECLLGRNTMVEPLI